MMSCIKFPSSKSELSKTISKENLNDYAVINSQLIASADKEFGQGNWSHGITNQTLDFVDYVNGKYHAGCASIVRVELKNRIFHESIGYGSAEGSSKASAIQKVRLASFNDGLKKALTCFTSDLTNKVNKPSRRSVSPLPVESSSCNLNTEARASTAINEIGEEAFAESISMSQTDVLMNIVDIDQLFDKDQQLNNVKLPQEEIKIIDIPMSVVSSDTEKKGVGFDNLNTKKEVKASTSTASNNLIDRSNKINIDNGLKKETKHELSKNGVPTVMTEEEMRLERKRKQREMQEEFKRQQEIKRMHIDNGSKPQPNPRF